MTRKLALFLSFLFLIASLGYSLVARQSRAADSNDTARELYDRGSYRESLEALQKNGLSTAADYYNAGNALYRMGKVGQALAHFEKALVLAPRNADIKYNLGLARESLSKSGTLPKDQSFWFGTFVPIARKIPEEFADLLLALTTAALALLAYRARKQKLTFQSAVLQPNFLAVLGLWFFMGALTAGTVMAHRAKLAAVTADTGVARSGPSDTFTELFKLPAGTMVELTGESRDGWRQVRFSLGNVGWIGDKDLLEL